MTQEAQNAKNIVDDVADKAEDLVDAARSTTKQAVDAIDNKLSRSEGVIDTAKDKAEAAVDATSDKLKGAIHTAHDKAKTLRDDLQPSIDALNTRVHEFAERTKQVCCDKRDQTKETVQQYADKTSAYVVDQPLKAVAIAAAAGAVLGLLMGRRR